jgi:cell division septum initiation protein DivIVA
MADNELKPKPQEVYRFRKSLDQMSISELCEEAVRVRDLIVDHSSKLNEIYATLYAKARRVADEASYSYISIANSGKRFSGMVFQAARRTAGLENRILTVVARDTEDRNRQKQLETQRLIRIEADKQKKASTPRDPLEAIYGIPPMSTEEVDLVSHGLSETTVSDIDDLYGEELP